MRERAWEEREGWWEGERVRGEEGMVGVRPGGAKRERERNKQVGKDYLHKQVSISPLLIHSWVHT